MWGNMSALSATAQTLSHNSSVLLGQILVWLDVHIFRFSLTTECNKSISPIPHIQVLKQKVSKLEKNKKQLLE